MRNEKGEMRKEKEPSGAWSNINNLTIKKKEDL